MYSLSVSVLAIFLCRVCIVGGVSTRAAFAQNHNKGFGKKTTNQSKPSAAAAAKNKRRQPSNNKPFVHAEQDDVIAQLQANAARTCLGQAVASSTTSSTTTNTLNDPFWELMPSLIASRFPSVKDHELERVAGVVRHTLDPQLPLEEEIVQNPHRRHDEMHAYMPGLGPTQAFYDPAQVKVCRQLCDNYETIRAEYQALVDDMASGGPDRFQSVTSMNYESGWKTLVLFYNGHRIDGFPYHLCPTTTALLESVPLAGRIAGFNRQQPQSGIPLHTDGNNMWLTCQMGISVPEGDKAWIRVGPETRRWKAGECLLYDTTYEHETFNEHPDQERVVLHVDFFNTIAMTGVEIQVMQYIYQLREEFMKAEGVAKVGAQIL
jgi:aspartyl/asparaginyl beta-hydroxylase (cupin superfamily)